MHESPPTDRRRFLATTAGLAAAAAPFVGNASGETRPTATPEAHSIRSPHFRPRAKRVIFLFMLGGPSQHDLFDDKPKLRQLDGQPIGDELLSRMKFAQIMEQRPSLLGSHVKFARHGQSGAEVSELLPHTARIVDDLAIVKTVKAEEIPHHPAEVYWHTGTRQFGRPSIGAWVQYGLGSESSDLPGYVVLQSGMRPRTKGSIYTAGFLSAAYQGVPLRDGAEPILNLAPPPGRSLDDERRIVEVVRRINALRSTVTRDPETDARSVAYQLAQRLSETAPEAIDVSRESAATLSRYGVDPRQPSFARNCLLARRLVERGVRFVHLCHGDWDHHSNLRQGLAAMCQQTDQACAALVADLKQRGLLDDTLVVWGGEFGRTAVGQKSPTAGIGRDHQISAFTIWMSGGGVRTGQTVGETDELGCFPVTRPIPVHDIQATILHLLGLDHRRLTFPFQGRDYRLTDLGGEVAHELIG